MQKGRPAHGEELRALRSRRDQSRLEEHLVKRHERFTRTAYRIVRSIFRIVRSKLEAMVTAFVRAAPRAKDHKPLTRTMYLVTGDEREALREAVATAALELIATGGADSDPDATVMALAHSAVKAREHEAPGTPPTVTMTFLDPVVMDAMDTADPDPADAEVKVAMLELARGPLARIPTLIPPSNLEIALTNVALMALGTMTILLAVEPAHDQPALPPRLQPLSHDRWESANDPFGDEIAAQLRLRCGMRDCPGDFGRISLTVSPEPINGATEHLVFEPARGLLRGKDGVWSHGKRAERSRKRGAPPLGRRPSGLRQDWQASQPLTSHEIPAISIALSRWGGPTEMTCPHCDRRIRLDSQKAYAALAGVRARA